MLTKKYDSKGNFYYVDSSGVEFRNKPNPEAKVERWITGEKPPPLDPSIKRVYQKIQPNVSEVPKMREVDYLLMKNSALSRNKKERKISKLTVDEKLYMGAVLNDRELEQHILDHEVPELTGHLSWRDTDERQT